VVAPGEPQIIVQDFVTPDPRLELATPQGAQRLSEVELSFDGRYRMEIFDRRYRVFDRTSGAKIVDRSGVKPRFSPSGRFVIASIGDAEKLYPTNFEVIDLVVGATVATVGGPIVGWSNGDALLLDGGRAYQSVGLFNTLVDPVTSTGGANTNWVGFFPGCGTCDAWTGSNILIDWDHLTVLRGDSDNAAAKAIAFLASGHKVDASLLDDEIGSLKALLGRVYGRPDLTLAKGWASNSTLALTHVGRGYDSYVGDGNSLQPAQPGRASQTKFLAPRRLALAEGHVLRPDDLRPANGSLGQSRGLWGAAVPARAAALDFGYVAEELGKLGLRLRPATPITEVAIPKTNGDVMRDWPSGLKVEVLQANASLEAWFSEGEMIVAAWRLENQGTNYLLLQHGDVAMTVNGAHDLRFDLLVLNGATRGRIQTFKEIGGLFSRFVGRDHTVARPMIMGDDRLVIAIPGTGKAAIVELANGLRASTIEMIEPTLLCGFYRAMGRALVVQSNCDGQFFLYDAAAASRPMLSGRIVDDELIVYDAQGYYTATYEGAHYVHIAFPGLGGVHSFEQFAKILNRPDLIRGIVQGTRSRLPPPALLPPPTLELTAATETPSGLMVTGTAKSDSGLSMLELYEDGRLEERRELTGPRFDQTINIIRRPHARTVTAVAIDVDGFRSRPATLELPAKAGAANVLHVVAVGVDEYEKLPRLKGARYDAESLVETLKSAGLSYYHEVRTTLRVNRDAAPAAVQTDISAAIQAAGANDTIMVFFAGHGGVSGDGRYFMATSQTDPHRLPETAIDWQEMAHLLGKARGRVIVIIDACHSGQTGIIQSTNDEAVASLATATDAPMVVLAASKGRQSSEEMPHSSGGVFTQSLTRLLGRDRSGVDVNGDGVLEISELYRKLKPLVEVTTNGRQTPWLVLRNVVGDAPLF